MLYIGKFINNFKDFYNDINSATLTGAIDVIVVRQPDGSYVCSPFHVRFGKIGVLRSREKVVDIEVNGVPVDIHMKLGESGEAFFVEEVSPEKEIPYYLATSPIPNSPDIHFELEKLKASNSSSTVIAQEQHLQTISNKDSNTVINISDNTTSNSTVINTSDKTTSNSTVINISDKTTSNSTVIVSENAGIVKIKADPNKNHCKSPNDAAEEHTDSSDEYKMKRKRKKKVSSKKRNKGAKEPAKKDTKPVQKEDDPPEEIFQMDEDLNDEDEGLGTSGLSRSISLPVQANIDTLFGREWTNRKMSSTFTGEFHPFSDGDVTPVSSPVASRPPSPKSDTEYENQMIECGSPDDREPSWGWGQLPNVPKNDQGTADNPAGMTEEEDKDKTAEAEKRSMLGGMLNFMRSTKKMRHMPESEGIYLSELNSDELDPELAALYFPKFKSTTYSAQQPQTVNDEDAESGKGSSLPHSPHTVEGGSIPDSDSDERLSFDQFSKEKCENISYPYSDIAMSLCGGLTEPDADLPEERFMHSQVTFDEFTENPGVLSDPNLVIRIGGKFYNWQTAASMLTSIIMFQRPLPEKTANQLILDHMPKKKKKSYSSWWSWRRSESEQKNEVENAGSMDKPPTLSEDSSLPPTDPNLPTPSTDTDVTPTIEESVQETIEVVTEVVSVVQDELQQKIPETPEPVEETVATSEEELVDQSLTSSDTSPVSSSPINIAGTPKSTPQETLELPSSLPETIAQPNVDAKEEDELSPSSEDKPSKEKYKKSLRLTSRQIENLKLKEGVNEVEFSVTTAYQGTTKCTCQVFLWNYNDKIVISDIDGTITKSDVLGHILPIVGHSWAQLGVAKLFTKIQENGYRFLYLSARAIGQARITRDYLRTVRQGEICLPDGPLLLSPTSLISALHREVIERKPEEFKIACLKDIQTLFPTYMGNPFYAGFGNKINDQWAYRAVGIPLTRSFTINHRGELKSELIQTFQSSYTRLSDDVDHVFPPLQPTIKVIFSSPEEFSYFTYWREPLQSIGDDDIHLP